MSSYSFPSFALGLVLMSACASAPKTPSNADDSVSSANARPRTEEAARSELTPTEAAAAQRLLANFQRIYFDFDSTVLDDESRKALSENVGLMAAHPKLVVEVQGHADDRGTSEYNLALGERRARAVETYMTTAGVPRGRIQVISYGEERPLEVGDDERAWSKNRRAEFRVVRGADAVDDSTSSPR